MTPPMKKKHPKENSSHGPKSSNRRRPTCGHANASVSQGNKQRFDEYEHYSSNHYDHKSSKNFSAYSFNYYNPPVKRNAYSSMLKFFINALHYIASQPPIQMWVVKKKN
jgi:hypothetical protein